MPLHESAAPRQQVVLDPLFPIPDTKVLSLLSAKGGVGKTTLAVNMAIELAPKHTVILIDCDIYNSGLTYWFSPFLRDISHSDVLSLSDVFSLDTPNAVSTDSAYRKRKPVRIDDHTLKNGSLFFVPSFYPYTLPPVDADSFRAQNIKHLSFSAKDYSSYMQKLVIDLKQRFHADFVILDCHPGMVPTTLACIPFSDSNIIVSDYDEATLQSSIIFLWMVESEFSPDPESQFINTASKTLHSWRFVVNRLPSSDLFERSTERLRTVLNGTNQLIGSLERLLPIKNKLTEHVTEVLVEVPALEEFLVAHTETIGPLHPRKRGGNGFILATKKMLRAMFERGLIGQNREGWTFADPTERIKNAFEELNKIYYSTRGVGKTGIEDKYFWRAVLAQCVFAMYLIVYFNQFIYSKYIEMALEGTIAAFFLIAVLYLWNLLRLSRKNFEIFFDMNPGADMEVDYHKGGTPGIVPSVWWPRFLWLMTFCSPFLFVLLTWVDKGYVQEGIFWWAKLLSQSVIAVIATKTLVPFGITQLFKGGIVRDIKFGLNAAKAVVVRRMYRLPRPSALTQPGDSSK